MVQREYGETNSLCMMKNVVGVLLKYFAGLFPQSTEKASLSEQKLQLCQIKGVIRRNHPYSGKISREKKLGGNFCSWAKMRENFLHKIWS